MAKSICEHIRNVKSSLENAEKSFRENNGMRGELDLMLAEAEIKHLREKRGWVSVWTRQRLALLAAAIVVLAGYPGSNGQFVLRGGVRKWQYCRCSESVSAQ